MRPQPLYHAEDLRAAYHLHYTWCGWPSGTTLPRLSDNAWSSLRDAWENDGLRVLQTDWSAERILITFSTRPDVSPVFLASRAKGRLQHASRSVDAIKCRFSRKLAVRSIGENRTVDVQMYIERQVDREAWADPRYRETLEQFTIEDELVDLATASESNSGRYWYNLHLVLVTDGRFPLRSQASLASLRDQSFRIASRTGYAISRLSVMPDHLHIALRGNVEHSPQGIALAFLNNLAHTLNSGRIWQRGYYAGTFSEYNMNAVRRRLDDKSASPATQGGRGRIVDGEHRV